MWEISYRDESGINRRCLVDQSKHAFEIAKHLTGKGYRTITRRCKTDVWIADPRTGEITLAVEKLTIVAGARWSADWAKVDRNCGCVLWPHGKRMPDGWRVVRVEA